MKKAVAVELQKIKLEPGDCLFIKVDIDKYSLEEAIDICQAIGKSVPKDIPVIGYPGPDVELQVVRKL